MKPWKLLLILCLTSLTGAVFAEVAMPAPGNSPPAAVSVGVYVQHAGGKFVYHYRVVNKSQQNIVAVTIGRYTQNDGNPANDINELLALPSGWNAKLGIPSTSSNSPTGWRVSVIDPEDNATHAVAWEVLNDRSPMILSGQTVNRMSVSLDSPDNNYLSSHALIAFADGNPASLTVPLDRLDVNPPNLTVILNPDTLEPNDKYAAIKAAFIIKDDYDRFPEIKLESITANEPLGTGDILDASIGLDDRYFKLLAASKNPSGRIYTVTYSATDASGNQSIASANVTVTRPAVQFFPASAPHE